MEEYEKQIEAMDEYTYQWKPENMDDPNEPILKITKSSLGSFNWCPKKYEFLMLREDRKTKAKQCVREQ